MIFDAMMSPVETFLPRRHVLAKRRTSVLNLSPMRCEKKGLYYQVSRTWNVWCLSVPLRLQRELMGDQRWGAIMGALAAARYLEARWEIWKGVACKASKNRSGNERKRIKIRRPSQLYGASSTELLHNGGYTRLTIMVKGKSIGGRQISIFPFFSHMSDTREPTAGLHYNLIRRQLAIILAGYENDVKVNAPSSKNSFRIHDRSRWRHSPLVVK